MNSRQRLVAYWMSEDPITITRGATAADALEIMRDNGLRRLPVVDALGDLVGMVTRSDLMHFLPHVEVEADNGHFTEVVAHDLPIEAVMSGDPVTIGPDEPVARAAELMREHQISGIPVVEERRPVGILTESDLFRMVAGL